MKKYVFTLFLLFIFNLSFSQFEINESLFNASVVSYDNIHVFNEDSDIVLTGDFFVTNQNNSIWIEPRDGYSITITPNLDTLQRTTTVGITDNDDDRPNSGISIYPNPASNSMTIIILPHKEVISLELYDNCGIRQTDPILETDNTVNLTNYLNGFYLLRIHLYNGQVISRTIIKQ